MKKKLEALVKTYGIVGFATYFALFLLVWAGFAAAIALGLDTPGPGANLGTLAAAYVATKLTQPLRIAATLALMPLVTKLRERLRPRAPKKAQAPPFGAPSAENHDFRKSR